ncbi:MAG: hypothetical protein IT353_15100 [Gemmatimonadaceae bacterium]|nr:hypothetical protein [Gemmatimonadaceae bacterium]
MTKAALNAIWAEFDRLQLQREDFPYSGLAFESAEAEAQFLADLRSLVPGATWYDVFPDLNEHRDLVDDEDPYKDDGRPLGDFDYQEAPRGSAVFASADLTADVAALTTALERALQLPIPVYGAGLVLNRGHPHLYIVLPLGAPEELVDKLGVFLREQPGLANAYPRRLESSNPRVTPP